MPCTVCCVLCVVCVCVCTRAVCCDVLSFFVACLCVMMFDWVACFGVALCGVVLCCSASR